MKQKTLIQCFKQYFESYFLISFCLNINFGSNYFSFIAGMNREYNVFVYYC
jgi:hypothetical protein